jgi:hypothetical protein
VTSYLQIDEPQTQLRGSPSFPERPLSAANGKVPGSNQMERMFIVTSLDENWSKASRKVKIQSAVFRNNYDNQQLHSLRSFNTY